MTETETDTPTRDPRGGQEWPQVVDAMRAEYARTGDYWLGHVVDYVDRGAQAHWYGWSVGCAVCRGHLHQCPSWGQAQSLALTWLLQKAGLA